MVDLKGSQGVEDFRGHSETCQLEKRGGSGGRARTPGKKQRWTGVKIRKGEFHITTAEGLMENKGFEGPFLASLINLPY